MAANIVWRGHLLRGLEEMEGKIHARMSAITHFTAQDMESWAKRNAPWTDRTGNARNGLHGDPDIVPLKSYAAHIAHGVPYGIWLEIANSGRYSIIMKTIQQQQAKTMALVSGLFRNL